MSPPELPPWAWLACYAVAIACSTGSFWLTISPRGRARGWTWVRIGLATLVVPVVAHLEGWAEREVDDDAKVWLRLGVFVLGIVVILVLFAHESWIGERSWWRTWGRPATFLSISLIAAIFIGGHFHQIVAPTSNNAVIAQLVYSVGPSREVDDMFGVSDLGRKIPLLQLRSTDGHFEPAELVPEPFRTRVIVAGDIHSTANCHGWVFTDGQYLIQGEYVDVILEDNGYRIVSDPRVGDLIVYRDDLGTVIHTGIVKAVGRDRFVLVESKWGALDAYYHLPNDQVYSMGYAYYRSSRDGHAIHLIMRSPSKPSPAREPQAAPEKRPALKSTPAING